MQARAASGALELGPSRRSRRCRRRLLGLAGTGGVSRRGRRLIYTLTPQLEGQFGPASRSRAVRSRQSSPRPRGSRGPRARLPLGVTAAAPIKVAATAPRFPSTRRRLRRRRRWSAVPAALDVAAGKRRRFEAWINASAQAERRTRTRLRQAPFDVLRSPRGWNASLRSAVTPRSPAAPSVLAIPQRRRLRCRGRAVAMAELRDEQSDCRPRIPRALPCCCADRAFDRRPAFSVSSVGELPACSRPRRVAGDGLGVG